MPTEQEAKPAVVTPSLQQWRSPSTFRGAPGEDPLKWLKEYDRVANFNKWDDMMCLANVYFFLDGTARQWYVNNEDALDSWEAFKNGLSGLFGDRQKYTRRAEEQLKCRAQRSGESTQSYIQSVLGLCQKINPLMKEDEKVSHLMKKFPPEPRKTDVWRTADNRPVCFHCGRPGHVMRYCRERKAVFDNSRNRRRNFDDVGTEEEIRRPNSSRRFTPSPTRGRSPIRRYRSPSPYRRSSQSPGRRSEEN
ncbi:CCHC-type domain-containing protein [Trichonephila clavipes]|nr:CCHC-type domain-containing protein [Trichonephila clavipes]